MYFSNKKNRNPDIPTYMYTVGVRPGDINIRRCLSALDRDSTSPLAFSFIEGIHEVVLLIKAG